MSVFIPLGVCVGVCGDKDIYFYCQCEVYMLVKKNSSLDSRLLFDEIYNQPIRIIVTICMRSNDLNLSLDQIVRLKEVD